MVANFVVASEDNEGLEDELREAFRLYDKEVKLYIISNDFHLSLFFNKLVNYNLKRKFNLKYFIKSSSKWMHFIENIFI